MEKYCPDCKEKLETIGLSGCGTVYRCNNCQAEWVIRKRPMGHEDEQY